MDIADQHCLKDQARKLETIQDYLESWTDLHDEHIKNIKRGTVLTTRDRKLIAEAVQRIKSAVLTLRLTVDRDL